MKLYLLAFPCIVACAGAPFEVAPPPDTGTIDVHIDLPDAAGLPDSSVEGSPGASDAGTSDAEKEAAPDAEGVPDAEEEPDAGFQDVGCSITLPESEPQICLPDPNVAPGATYAYLWQVTVDKSNPNYTHYECSLSVPNTLCPTCPSDCGCVAISRAGCSCAVDPVSHTPYLICQ